MAPRCLLVTPDCCAVSSLSASASSVPLFLLALILQIQCIDDLITHTRCAAFGINSSKFSPLYTVVINIVFWCASLPPAFVTLNKIGVEGGYFPSAAKLSSAVVPAVTDESDEASRSSDVDDVEKPVGEAEVSQARV